MRYALTGLVIAFTTLTVQAEPPTKALSGGGGATVFNQSKEAFAKPLPALSSRQLREFTFGNRIFNTNWVTAPASVDSFDGLGPTFNRVSCSGCHFKDGRGRPPLSEDEPMTSMLIRLSIKGKDAVGGPKPHPVYGGQLNDKAILGVPAEGHVIITYDNIHGAFADGESYSLRAPKYTFRDLSFGPMEGDVLFSPRVAPAVHGLGLLEAVSADTLLDLADEEDENKDGISGRVNWVWDQVKGQTVVGKFGWKANQPNLRQQDAGAALGDIGLTTSLNPNENCPPKQTACQLAPHGGKPELNDDALNKLIFYTQTLAVPARRNLNDEQVIRGEALFRETGCGHCHAETLTTGEHDVVGQLSHKTIHPYSDLLLHDMGPGLADNRPDFEASGQEWRTPPLWGIGLVETVNSHTFFLHDGRARNLTEAILWHGGEAKATQQKFLQMSKKDRQDLLAFLESL